MWTAREFYLKGFAKVHKVLRVFKVWVLSLLILLFKKVLFSISI